MVDKNIFEPALKEKQILALEQGIFNNLHIDSWFRNKDFDYIFATIKGCEKIQNLEILTYISQYAYHLYKSYYSEIYLKILKLIILYVAKIRYYRCPAIIFLYESPIDEIRLYCVANLDYNRYFNDKCPYIVKVAQIRKDVSIKLGDENVRKQVNFFKSALENGLIDYKKLPDSEMNGDEYAIEIQSSIFYDQSYKIFVNKNIVDNMGDNKLIIASIINDFLEQEKIILNNEFFQDISGIIRKRTYN